jgi:hypothetical protein
MHSRPDEPAEDATASGKRRRFLLGIAVGIALVVLLVVWHAGVFDDSLYRIHLNARDCFYGPKGELDEVECGGGAGEEVRAVGASQGAKPRSPRNLRRTVLPRHLGLMRRRMVGQV